MNYSAINSILDDFEKVFKDLKVNHNLSHAVIERWRWDLPNITLTWLAEDAIWRNIHVLVDAARGAADPFIEKVEVNAWQDLQRDNRWIRRWQHQVIRKAIAYNKLQWQDDHAFASGYILVAHWTSKDLTNQQPLSQAAAEFLEQQL